MAEYQDVKTPEEALHLMQRRWAIRQKALRIDDEYVAGRQLKTIDELLDRYLELTKEPSNTRPTTATVAEDWP